MRIVVCTVRATAGLSLSVVATRTRLTRLVSAISLLVTAFARLIAAFAIVRSRRTESGTLWAFAFALLVGSFATLVAAFAAGRATYALGSHGRSAALSFGRGSCSPVDTRTQTATIGSETFALTAFVVLRAIAISARAPAAVGEFLAPAFVFDTHVFLILGFDDVCFSLVSLFFILNTCICLRRDGSQLGFHVFADV